MAEPAFKRTMNTPTVAHEPIQIRRFEMPDLHQHGPWLTQRLLATYPHLSQQQLWGWLQSLLNSNEFLFLYQPHAVALAQVRRGHTLSPRSVIQEQFVFVEDKDDAGQVDGAAAFYLDFARWARAQDAEAIVLSELSDVPPEKIKVGRRFDKMQTFLKLDK